MREEALVLILAFSFMLFDYYYGEPIRPVKCPSGWLDCGDRLCLEPKRICDGNRDCDNGKDELNCKENKWTSRTIDESSIRTTTEGSTTCKINDDSCTTTEGSTTCTVTGDSTTCTTTEEAITCKNSYCTNNGECFIKDGKKRCRCAIGFHGETCRQGHLWLAILFIVLLIVMGSITTAIRFYQRCCRSYPVELFDPEYRMENISDPNTEPLNPENSQEEQAQGSEASDSPLDIGVSDADTEAGVRHEIIPLRRLSIQRRTM